MTPHNLNPESTPFPLCHAKMSVLLACSFLMSQNHIPSPPTYVTSFMKSLLVILESRSHDSCCLLWNRFMICSDNLINSFIMSGFQPVGRNDVFTIRPKYYNRAENRSAEMTIRPKNIIVVALLFTDYY